jgi:chorismate lyase / 3-hydroxybenzoate synthase
VTSSPTVDALAGTVPLHFTRRVMRPAEVDVRQTPGRWVGDRIDALRAPLLQPASAVLDTWCADGDDAPEGRHGCVRYATDGHWLHGCAEIDDRGLGVQAAARHAYQDIFDVLGSSACPHLLRLWNYLAGINVETDGVERYRQFNTGRQQAFIEARRSAFEGAPAACALGTRDGPLRVYFLAGRRSPLAIENPRQVSAYRYPRAYGVHAPTFSRAALADVGAGRRALFISGTASIVGHATVHIGDVTRQTEESLANITVLREIASERTGLPFPAGEMICTVYLRHEADLPMVREVFEHAVGHGSRAARDALYLQADICRSDLLVEIEAHMFAPVGTAA